MTRIGDPSDAPEDVVVPVWTAHGKTRYGSRRRFAVRHLFQSCSGTFRVTAITTSHW